MKDKLNLGCGKDIISGYINVDFENFEGVDMVFDLNKLPYPFENDSFSAINMRNILEHLEDPYSVIKEIHRIVRPEGIVTIRVPHFTSVNVWGDIQHKRGYNTMTFVNQNVASRFDLVKQKITFSRIRRTFSRLINRFPGFYEKNFGYLFPAVALVVELKAKKQVPSGS